jgi:GNAT superfamily N-acetyltransferase
MTAMTGAAALLSGVVIEPLTGAALVAALPALARLRIEVFRAWPYLYEGTLDYEQGYLRRFAAARDAVVVAARDGAEIVGVATASPLTEHTAKFAPDFSAHGFDPDRVFYCGESVLLPAYRGRGIGNAFFAHREAQARACVGPAGRYTHSAFCGVIRPDQHPARPAGYVPLDSFWRRRGYAPVPGLVGHFSWQDVGDRNQTEHPMQFWAKPL